MRCWLEVNDKFQNCLKTAQGRVAAPDAGGGGGGGRCDFTVTRMTARKPCVKRSGMPAAFPEERGEVFVESQQTRVRWEVLDDDGGKTRSSTWCISDYPTTGPHHLLPPSSETIEFSSSSRICERVGCLLLRSHHPDTPQTPPRLNRGENDDELMIEQRRRIIVQATTQGGGGQEGYRCCAALDRRPEHSALRIALEPSHHGRPPAQEQSLHHHHLPRSVTSHHRLSSRTTPLTHGNTKNY